MSWSWSEFFLEVEELNTKVGVRRSPFGSRQLTVECLGIFFRLQFLEYFMQNEHAMNELANHREALLRRCA